MSNPAATVVARSGPRPVALLHGVMMSPTIWRHTALVAELRGHLNAYALPAHPTWELDADKLRPLLSMKSLVDSYASALERDFGLQPVDFVGHSTGAFLALAIAAHRPELVRRVVVISGFFEGAMDSKQPLPMRITCLPVIGSLAFRVGVKLASASPTMFVTASARSTVSTRTDPRQAFWDAFDEVRLGIARCDLRALALYIRWLSSVSLSAELPRVTAPVLIVVGSSDPVVPVSHQLSLVRRLRHSRLLVLDQVGHLPMMEAQERISRAVSAWFGTSNLDTALDSTDSAALVADHRQH
jgi:pimeloyl-ACP methyl ester carboxylesterase